MVINLNNIDNIIINKKSMSCLYQNNVLLWSKGIIIEDEDDYPTFLASSQEGGTFYTFDGMHWKNNLTLRRLRFTCIKADSNIAIGGTNGPRLYYSYNGGVKWTEYSQRINARATSIAFGNGLALVSYVDNGQGPDDCGIWFTTSYESTGHTWSKMTDYTGPAVASLTFSGSGDITSGNGQFFAGTESGMWVCSQYPRWNKVENSLLNDFLWENIVYNRENSILVAASMHKENSGGGIVWSTDAGNTWNLATLTNRQGIAIDIKSGSWKSIVYGNGRFIANSVGGQFVGTITSIDGKNWRETTDKTKWNALTFGDEVFVGAIQKPASYREEDEPDFGLKYSSDGVNWEDSNVYSSEFCAVEHVDSQSNTYMTGTTLRFINTNSETIAKVGFISHPGVIHQSVGIQS